MITKDIEKRIRELRYKQSSWKKCLKVERDMYFKTKKQISEILKKEDNVNISVQQIGNLLTEKLSYLRSKDYHSFSDYDSNIGVSKTIKKKDNVQLKHRYRVYVMFYKFLQLAIKEKRKIDFTKFKDFGSKDFILNTNFDTLGSNKWVINFLTLQKRIKRLKVCFLIGLVLKQFIILLKFIE